MGKKKIRRNRREHYSEWGAERELEKKTDNCKKENRLSEERDGENSFSLFQMFSFESVSGLFRGKLSRQAKLV